MVWMDLVRGIAIALVLVSHMAAFGREGQLFGGNGFIDALDRIAIVIRMPILMFLSGMLVPRSLAKGWQKFLPGKFTKLAWPYILWLTIWAAMNWIHEVGQPSDLWIAYVNPAQAEPYLAGTILWYLWNLFLYYLIAQAAYLLRIPMWTLVAGSFVWLAALEVSGMTLVDKRFPFLLIFFLLGAMFMEQWKAVVEVCRRPPVTALLIGLAASPVVMNFARHIPINPRYSFFFVAGTLAFILLLIAWLSLAPKNWATAPLMYVGRYSLYFYVSHSCTYVAYVWWIGWRYDLPYIGHALIMLILGFGLPVLAIELSKVLPPVKWLFEFPLKTRSTGSERKP